MTGVQTCALPISMEVTKEARSLVMRIPLEGGGRLVVELNGEEAANLGSCLQAAVQLIKK